MRDIIEKLKKLPKNKTVVARLVTNNGMRGVFMSKEDVHKYATKNDCYIAAIFWMEDGKILYATPVGMFDYSKWIVRESPNQDKVIDVFDFPDLLKRLPSH